jgi:hypothetical protein
LELVIAGSRRALQTASPLPTFPLGFRSVISSMGYRLELKGGGGVGGSRRALLTASSLPTFPLGFRSVILKICSMGHRSKC